MKFTDFQIGTSFYTATGKWQVTDMGSRVVVAIKIDPVVMTRYATTDGSLRRTPYTEEEARSRGLFSGPPYGLAETVFDEYDLGGCSPEPWVDQEPLPA